VGKPKFIGDTSGMVSFIFHHFIEVVISLLLNDS